jgi:hypothetical protein
MTNDPTRNERQRRHQKLKRRSARIVPVPVDYDILDLLEAEGYFATAGIPDWSTINRSDISRALLRYLKDQAG